MRLGPINLSSVASINPLKHIQAKTVQGRYSVMWGAAYPLAQLADVVEYSIDIPVLGAAPLDPTFAAKNRALVTQILELAANPDWQRSGVYLVMRDDFNDSQDGWYSIGAFTAPEDDPSQHGWVEGTLDILLRNRRGNSIGMVVDQKAQQNDANATGIGLGVYPQGVGSGYPAGTWAFAGADGSTIAAVETPPSVMRAPFSNPTNCMTLGRCAAFDTDGSASITEIFNRDHQLQQTKCQISNQLVRYTIIPGTPGHPLIEVWTGAAWTTLGNFKLQAYSGSAYTALPVQEFALQVVSPEEIIWEERRYDTTSVAFSRVVNRIRRGSRIIESQVIAGSGQGLIGAQSVALTGTGASAVATTADGTAAIATGAASALPGFLYLTAPATAATFGSTNLYSGLSVPAGTVTRFGILAGYQDAMYTALPTPGTPSAPTLLVVHNSLRGLLTQNQYDVETNTTGWDSAGGNCTIARSAAQFFEGTHSLSMTASSASTMFAYTLAGLSGVAAVAGKKYCANTQIRANTTGRSVSVQINWYNSAGTNIGASTTGAGTDSNSGWLALTTGSVTAPALTAFMAVVIIVTSPANTEVHYVDATELYQVETYTYAVAARSTHGIDSAASATASSAVAPITLGGDDYVLITFPATPSNWATWDVIRTAAGGTPSTVGVIGTGITAATFADTGLAVNPAGTFVPQSQQQGYAARWSAYNRMRIRQRIVIE